jgi:1-acyl-sn-glycerol-3-phosphate acyltransferase
LRDAVIFVFGAILRVTLAVWLRIVYNIKGYNDQVKDMPGPFLLIGNHCLNWDPFMAGMFLKPNTRFIASDSLFRDRAVAFLLTYLVGAIPKKKAVSDMKTIKLSIKELRKGHVVGVYPEANRTWDGRSIDILYSTAKFVKLMKVPVVNCVMKGGYLSRPRWSVRGRKGVLELHFEVLFTKEDVKKLSLDELYETMNKAIWHDEFEWQKNRMIRYKSKRPAEYLENYLYICPRCHKIGTLVSDKTEFKCTVCGLTHTMGEYGYFINEDRKFESPQGWGNWQDEYFKGLVDTDEVIYSDSQAVLYSEKANGGAYKVDEGNLMLYKDRIVFNSPSLNRTFFINDIFGNTIQLNCVFDFYYKGDFVRFRFLPKNRASAYKWNYAVDYLKS